MTRVIPCFALLLACDGDLTEIVVQVETDLAVPQSADRVEIDVFGLGPTTQSSGGSLDSLRRTRTVTLVHEGGPLGPIEVVGRVLHRGAPVVERHARVWFAADRTVLLRLRLLASCVGVSCAADQTCGEAGCRSILHDVEPWPPGPRSDDAGASPDVGSSRDAGHDAASDAGPNDAASGDTGIDSGASGADAGAPPYDAGTDAGCVAIAEACNGLDDDCDGESDEVFDLSSDRDHCGACMRSCDAGDVCVASECRDPHEAVSISAGSAHSCAARLDGTVVCWGSNADCELGMAAAPGGTTLVVVGGLSAIEEVAAGSRHTCALDARGTVHCWGRNDRSQTGRASSSDVCAATAIPALTAVQITSGDHHSCAIDDTGAVWCWGDDSDNQIGAVGDRALPTEIVTPDLALQVSAGGSHTCAVLATGEVACWGRNDDGQLGRSTSGGVGFAPIAARAIRVAGGGDHTCSLGADGSVECWGLNDRGQLGFAGASRSTPTVVAITGVVDLEAGDEHTCAVLGSGAVNCWGSNTVGQLGDGTVVPRSSPTAVSTIADAARVSAGREHTCILRRTGSVSCFGDNSGGELGRGGDSRVPADVVGIP
jgi:hypothetical protein